MSEPGMHARVGGQLLTGPTYVREAGVLEPVTVEVKPETSLAYLKSLTGGSSPLAWYDAEHVNGFGAAQPAHGDTLGNWADLSGNGYDLNSVSGGSSARPTFRTSGYGITAGMPAAVELDGVNDNLFRTAVPRAATLTLYEVIALASELAVGETELRAMTHRNASAPNEGAWFRVVHSAAQRRLEATGKNSDGVGFPVSTAPPQAQFSGRVHVMAGSFAAAMVMSSVNGQFGTPSAGVHYVTSAGTGTLITGDTAFQKPHMIGAMLVFPTAHDYDTVRRVSRWLGARFGASVA
jgi:hypothetical protein